MKLPSLQDVRVVVVGDLMLDRYWFGEARRVSQEAPVPVVNVEHIEDRPGGAANVALNVVSLGAKCTLLGAVGDDEAGASLEATLTAAGVDCDFLKVAGWPTVLKLRVLSQKQQLLRTDFEMALAPSSVMDLSERLAAHIEGASVVVLQDYDKGTLVDPEALMSVARAASVPVVVDPKYKPFARYAGAALLKPNLDEFQRAVGPWKDDDELLEKAQAVAREHEIEALVVTRGGQGNTVVSADGSHRHVPGLPVDVFDETGAGDTSAAALAITRALGWRAEDCARIANVASGLVVGKTGTSVVTGPELASALASDDRTDRGVMSAAQLTDSVALARAAGQRVVFTNGCFDILHAGHVAYLEEARALGDRLVVGVNDDASDDRTDRGVMSAAQLTDSVALARAAGQRVVFTNGCFDILHAGHVAYLEEARALGDRLVVGVNDDASVTRLKGSGRPVNPLEQRLRVLAGLSAVDWVVGFSEDTPELLLERLMPDVLVKGGDYGVDEVVGAEIVRGYGGEVRVLSLVDDCSTTAIVGRIQQSD